MRQTEPAPPARLTVTADNQGVRAGAAFATDFAAARLLGDEEAARLLLVVEELLTNLAKYGYPDGTPGRAELTLDRDDTHWRLELVDDGAAFDPLAAPPPPDLDAEIEDRAVGGLGLHLVRSLAEQARYRREGGRNRLTMSRRL